jgi:hypothetical protein
MKRLSDEVTKINAKIFKQKGKIYAGLMLNWARIVGEQYSYVTYPKNIREVKENSKINKTLYVAVKNSSIGVELSCHKEIIIERAAMFLGFRAIDRIRIIAE